MAVLVQVGEDDGGIVLERIEDPVAVGTTALRLLESAADDAGHVKPFKGDTDLFILPVAALVNRKLVSKALEEELENVLSRIGIQGGAEFHRLLRPMISETCVKSAIIM